VSSKTLRVAVTRLHAAMGRRADCYRCPICLAIADALPGSRPFVGPGSARLSMGESGEWFDLPDFVADATTRFDGWGKMDPFSFDWELPSEVVDFFSNRR
jgi:hypothetical protein